jgi:hypothetical protein
VLFTWDPASENSWLNEYFPHLVDLDRLRFPSLTALQDILGEIEVIPVRIPHDCTDGFMGAYWRRPSAYLDLGVRSAISSLSTGESSVSLAHLADDLSTGTWEKKHGQVLKYEDLDLGYRLVIASLPSNMPLTDKGRSTLGRRSTSRGRAAHQMNEGRRAAPAVLLSTIT